LSVQEAPWRPKSGNSVKGSKYQTLGVIFHTQSLTHMMQMMDLETVGGFLPPLLELMNDDENLAATRFASQESSITGGISHMHNS
jgi:hypothetical protein